MATNQMMLSDFWKPESVRAYKIHFARYNGKVQPLHVFLRSMEEWKTWQKYYPSKNDFNRQSIFSLIQIPSQPDLWMFGGIWTVNGTNFNSEGLKEYDVSLSEELKPMIGRLELYRAHKGRGTRLKLEGHYEKFVVAEVLPDHYTGRAFPGYNSVHLSFQELELHIKNRRQDWATALGHVKGVYLITDVKSQRRYVGSAYGESGIWSRWKEYVELGHGGNSGMRELLRNLDLEYCRQNFELALLEHHDCRVDDTVILERENYWKQVLGTRRKKFGLNRN